MTDCGDSSEDMGPVGRLGVPVAVRPVFSRLRTLAIAYGVSCRSRSAGSGQVGPVSPRPIRLLFTAHQVGEVDSLIFLLAVAIWTGHNYKVSTSVLGADGSNAPD